jgi:hypothetical protein
MYGRKVKQQSATNETGKAQDDPCHHPPNETPLLAEFLIGQWGGHIRLPLAHRRTSPLPSSVATGAFSINLDTRFVHIIVPITGFLRKTDGSGL